MKASSISQRLDILISYLHLTQKGFAKQTGVDSSTICRILKGDYEPTMKNIEKIVNSTGVSPSWLMGYGNDELIEMIK